MQIGTYEHVFPLKKTCGISPLEHQASGILEKYFLLEYSLPWRSLSPPEDFLPLRRWYSLSDVISLSDKLWCDLSLPLWHQFPRRAFWNLSWMGLILESQHKALDKNVMFVRGQDSLSGAGSEESQNKWQTLFPIVKSVAPTGMLRLYRKDSVGPKLSNRWNRVHHKENTCHRSSLD